MYQRDSDSWIKHWDFILLDMLCLQAAFLLGYALAGYGFDPYQHVLYRDMAFFIEVVDFVTILLFSRMRDVLKRGPWRELSGTLQQGFIIGGISILYLFLLQMGQNYSRLALLLMVVLYIVLAYTVRMLWKHFLKTRMKKGGNRALLIITTADGVEKVVANLRANNYARFNLVGIALTDQDRVGQFVDGVEVVANNEGILETVCQEWVDEVLIVIPEGVPYPQDMIESIAETGVVVHYNLDRQLFMAERRQFIETIGAYTVVTTSMNFATRKHLIVKRLMDIGIGLVGTVCTGIIFVFIAPVIYAKSPGPIFYSQERVGKNGRRFKMYKFRSMYMDADARRAELLERNKLGDGKMFKMDFDPRVIGNELLADGTVKRGVGDFIRRTSLDEFPQFVNVLRGDMSVVGTRPPLPDETNLYETHHYARLAIKPGITGLWQISGRSNITDFEEVVRLDKEYINNWSLKLDMKILLKTIVIVVKGEGSV